MSDKSINVVLPTTGFRKSMFFNRIAVERADLFVHISFGFVNAANVTVSSYSTVITELELKSLQDNLMEYLGRLGSMVANEPPPWQPPNVQEVELANHISMARHGTIAETLLHQYSHWAALQESRKLQAQDTKSAVKQGTEKNQIENPDAAKAIDIGLMGEPVALLRSPLGVQQHLIRLLFVQEQRELDVK
ncbi:MAG: hypothetical protein HZA89_00210 [Verrucomicrobia bacterium]|nr:hypothetical protein [Verrucomicrobiota bacterium]